LRGQGNTGNTGNAGNTGDPPGAASACFSSTIRYADSMMRTSVVRFFDEILLYSGQFALFYLLMNFSDEGMGLFLNVGHATLLATLLIQTGCLARWGDRSLPRFFLSLAAPSIYLVMEGSEGVQFLLDSGHVLFWSFSLLVAGLQAASRRKAAFERRRVSEFLVMLLNVGAFFAIYIVFDLKLVYAEAGHTPDEVQRMLGIEYLASGIRLFLDDPTHIYVLGGGAFLALSLAVGRVKILSLTERINALFGQYVDPKFRDEIVSKEGGAPRERELCILFSDIRNFTTLSEKEGAARSVAMLNRYFTEWEELVTRYGGIVDKYIGDAVMAIFGAGDALNPCDDAASCSLEMLHRMRRLEERLREEGLPVPEGIGVGLDYGPVLMGDLGSRKRKNYTVIGDHVNTASRLEAMCTEFGTTCVISEAVARRLGASNAARFKELGEATLKGKNETVRVRGLSADRPDPSADRPGDGSGTDQDGPGTIRRSSLDEGPPNPENTPVTL